MSASDESSFRRRVRAGRSSMRAKAREFVDTCLLKDLDDPDDYRLDVVGWDEWEDFIDFAESVLETCEVLTWGRLAA